MIYYYECCLNVLSYIYLKSIIKNQNMDKIFYEIFKGNKTIGLLRKWFEMILE